MYRAEFWAIQVDRVGPMVGVGLEGLKTAGPLTCWCRMIAEVWQRLGAHP